MREGLQQKNEENAFFHKQQTFLSRLKIPEMIRLHGSVKEIWRDVNERFVLPVKDQVTIMKKTDANMPTLLTCFN